MRNFVSVLAGVLAVAASAEIQPSDCDVFLETSDAANGLSSFVDGANWSDRNEPSSTKTYYVGADKVLWARAGGSFAGKMLAVKGSVFCGAATGDALTWPDLRLLDGSAYKWQDWKVAALSGRVTVEGTVAFDGFYVRTENGSPDGRPYLRANFFSGADGELELDRREKGANRGAWNISGDWSSYLGAVRVKSGNTFRPSINPYTLGGTLVVDQNGEFYNTTVNGGLTTVGSLVMSDGSCLRLRMWGTNGIQPITVTNALTLGQNVTMNFGNNSPQGAYSVGQTDKRLSVFELSAAAAAKPYDLSGVAVPDLAPNQRIGPFPRLHHLVEVANPSTGGKTVYAKYEDDRSRIYRMKTENGTANAATSAFLSGNASYWDLAGQPAPTSEGDIYAAGALLFHSDNAPSYSFPGLECTIGPGHGIYHQTGSVYFKRWHFTPGSGLNSYTGAQQKNVSGNITTYGYAGSSPITFTAFSYVTVNVNDAISGNGDLKLTCGVGRGQSGIGSFGLYGNNSAFSGNLSFAMQSSTNTWNSQKAQWEDTQFPKLETGRYLTVAVTNGNAFGGAYEGSTAWRSLHVNCYSAINVMDDSVFDEPSRGMFVEWGAQVSVARNKSFVIGVPLTLAGELIKKGEGTLVLSGEARFIDGNPATEPMAGTNVLTVADGALKVAASNAANGLAISFEEGAKLLVDSEPRTPEMAETGFVATRWTVPLATTAADGRIVVELDGELPDADIAVPICTVTAAAANNLSFRLVRRPRYRASVVPRANMDGTVTFVAKYEKSGFSLVFR